MNMRKFRFGLEGARLSRTWRYDAAVSALAAARARLSQLQESRERARVHCENKVLDSLLAWKRHPDPARQSAALSNIAAAHAALVDIECEFRWQENAVGQAARLVTEALAAKEAIDRLRDDQFADHHRNCLRAAGAAADEAWLLRHSGKAG